MLIVLLDERSFDFVIFAVSFDDDWDESITVVVVVVRVRFVVSSEGGETIVLCIICAAVTGTTDGAVRHATG